MKAQAKIGGKLLRSAVIFFAALLSAILIAAQCLPSTASAAEPPARSGACVAGSGTIAECFPDPVLAATVAKAGSDSGHQLTTSSRFDATVASRIKQISVKDKNLANLEGINLLTSLRILYIPESQLTDVSPIANLIGLTDLTINSSPNIESFTPISGLANLVNLSLKADGINSDDKPLPSLSQLSSLIYLDLSNNFIGDISFLRGLTQLMRLSLIDNNVTDISALRDLPSLTYLYLQNDDQLPPYEQGNGVTDLTPIRNLPLTQFVITDQRPTDLATSTSTVSINVPKSTDSSFIEPTAGSIQPSSGSYNPLTGTVTWNNLELEYVDEVSFGFYVTKFPGCTDNGCRKFGGKVSRTLPFTPEAFSLDPSPNTQAEDPVIAPKVPGQPDRPKPTTPQQKPQTPQEPTPDPAPKSLTNNPPKTPSKNKEPQKPSPSQPQPKPEQPQEPQQQQPQPQQPQLQSRPQQQQQHPQLQQPQQPQLQSQPQLQPEPQSQPQKTQKRRDTTTLVIAPKQNPVVAAEQPVTPHDSLAVTGATITVVTVVAIAALALGIYLITAKKKRDK